MTNHVDELRSLADELLGETVEGVGFAEEEVVAEMPSEVALPERGGFVPLEVIQLAAKLEAEGYTDRAVAHACELGVEELAGLRESDSRMREARGAARRAVVAREQGVDAAWDDVEQRAVAELKLELLDSAMLTAGEKLAIARAANMAQRKRDREAEREAKRVAAGAGVAVQVNSHSVLQLELPKEFVQQLAAAQSEASRVIDRQAEVAELIEADDVHVGFEEAGRVLGVDLGSGEREGGAAGEASAVDAIAKVPGGEVADLIATEAG